MTVEITVKNLSSRLWQMYTYCTIISADLMTLYSMYHSYIELVTSPDFGRYHDLPLCNGILIKLALATRHTVCKAVDNFGKKTGG